MLQIVGILGLCIGAVLFARFLRASSVGCVASMTDEQLMNAVQEAQDWAETSNPALDEVLRRQAGVSKAPAPETSGPALAPFNASLLFAHHNATN